MKKSLSPSIFLIAVMIVLAPAAAPAQAPISPPEQTGPTPAPRHGATGPQQSEEPAPDRSDQLSRSRGVIAPPSTSDQNVVPMPSAGPNAMPVIPPPGTEGGNPEVQPK